MDAWLKQNLACPIDHQFLRPESGALICPSGHQYPVFDDIPILLPRGVTPTQKEFQESLRQTASEGKSPALKNPPNPERDVDPFVQEAVAATCGRMYQTLRGKLRRYPIPDIPLPEGRGKHFLDVGCNWGRWCISAAQKGYAAIGVDHNLQAIQAAQRVARHLGVPSHFLVADARYLPFASDCFDTTFSYSVLQHFDEGDARFSIREAARVLKTSGTCLIQMPNTLGPMNLYSQWKRKFRAAIGFEVRYWTLTQLKKTFEELVGPTTLFADGYLSLNPQAINRNFLPLRYQFVVSLSESLKKLSRIVPGLIFFADSVYAHSIRKGD